VLPIPDPRDLLALLPRTVRLLDEAEALLGRIEETRRSAQDVVDRTAATTERADALLERSDAVAEQADALLVRITGTVDRLDEPLATLQPMLERLAETTEPHEVDALVAVIDQLPELSGIIRTMSTVSPDLHELLRTSQELNQMLSNLPFVNRDD
jgi:ABC-type transporter Mla subunit MlaD